MRSLFLLKQNHDLTIVGPEILGCGNVDEFRKRGLRAFGLQQVPLLWKEAMLFPRI
jgi:phosphoribosylamine-glycine ligase